MMPQDCRRKHFWEKWVDTVKLQRKITWRISVILMTLSWNEVYREEAFIGWNVSILASSTYPNHKLLFLNSLSIDWRNGPTRHIKLHFLTCWDCWTAFKNTFPQTSRHHLTWMSFSSGLITSYSHKFHWEWRMKHCLHFRSSCPLSRFQLKYVRYCGCLQTSNPLTVVSRSNQSSRLCAPINFPDWAATLTKEVFCKSQVLAPAIALIVLTLIYDFVAM